MEPVLPANFTQPYNSWLAFDPTNKNVAYATYSTFGVPHVWKSIDAGAAWTNISGSGNTGIPDIPVLSIVVDPTNTSRLYVGTDLGVFTSIDGGANWMVENTGFANVSTEALAILGTNLYAFTHGRGAYRVSLVGGTPAPAASFTFTPASPQLGQTVQFTDTSTNSPTAWSWSFGDGATSAAQNPAHLYTASGTYTVSLTASNSGGSGSTTRSLTVAPEPVGRGHALPIPRTRVRPPIGGRQ